MFLCLWGQVPIEMRDGSVDLAEGEWFVVPGGVGHRPVAQADCHVLLIEPKGVVNTGDAERSLTAPDDERNWPVAAMPVRKR